MDVSAVGFRQPLRVVLQCDGGAAVSELLGDIQQGHIRREELTREGVPHVMRRSGSYLGGSQPAGRIAYDADGHVTALVMHEKRNEASGARSSPEVQADFSAYFGTYSVDTAQRIVTHHVRGSLNAQGASGELRRNYELKDGALILTFTRQQDGAMNTLRFKRVSRPTP
jgi:Lipocalin-like domain